MFGMLVSVIAINPSARIREKLITSCQQMELALPYVRESAADYDRRASQLLGLRVKESTFYSSYSIVPDLTANLSSYPYAVDIYKKQLTPKFTLERTKHTCAGVRGRQC